MPQTIADEVNRLSESQFLADYPDGRFELVRGELRETAMPGGLHGIFCFRMALFLGLFVQPRNLGHLFTNDTFVRLGQDHVRGMDVAYVSYAKLPAGSVPLGPLEVAPELVVEVKSPSDSWTDVMEKVQDYLDFGVSVVLVIDGEKQAVMVYRTGDSGRQLNADDTLTLPELLPGFSLPIQQLFA